jgi:hypothetical protein
MIKRIYLWTKDRIEKADIYVEDLKKKPVFPQGSRLAQIHQRILDSRRKRK